MKLRIFILLSFLLHFCAGIWFLQNRSFSSQPQDLAIVEISEVSQSLPFAAKQRPAISRKIVKLSATLAEKVTQPLKETESPEQEVSPSSASTLNGPPPSSSSFEPVSVGIVTVAPKLLFKKKIPYPVSAGRAGVEGVVDLKIVVDQEGRVKEAEVVRGPGYGLDEAALAAVRECLFSPAFKGAEKVPVRMGFKYEFQLGER